MSVNPPDEWLIKAERDFGTALDLAKLKNPQRADAICFHCQQAAEKYLKAYLHRNRIFFPKTHDLGELRVNCEKLDQAFGLLRLSLDFLQPFSVAVRYPGLDATEQDAVKAIKGIKQVRQFVRARLGLK